MTRHFSVASGSAGTGLLDLALRRFLAKKDERYR